MNSSLSISSFFSVFSLGDNTSVAKEFLTWSISVYVYVYVITNKAVQDNGQLDSLDNPKKAPKCSRPFTSDLFLAQNGHPENFNQAWLSNENNKKIKNWDRTSQKFFSNWCVVA